MAENLPALSTEMRKIFVGHVADGMKPVPAARKAGFSHPSQEAWRLMQDESIVRAIQRAAASRTARLAGAALSTCEELMGDKFPPTVRLGAAKAILDRDAGNQKDNGNKDLDKKSLADMTEDELHQVVLRARKRRAEMDREEGDNAGHSAEGSTQVIDITPEDSTSAT